MAQLLLGGLVLTALASEVPLPPLTAAEIAWGDGGRDFVDRLSAQRIYPSRIVGMPPPISRAGSVVAVAGGGTGPEYRFDSYESQDATLVYYAPSVRSEEGATMRALPADVKLYSAKQPPLRLPKVGASLKRLVAFGATQSDLSLSGDGLRRYRYASVSPETLMSHASLRQLLPAQAQ